MLGKMGDFLYNYENERYTLTDRLGLHLRSIIVPPQPEIFADVSFWDASVNWDTYKQHARAVIIRLGQGLNVDTEFEYNYKSIRDRGLILGGYWFYDDRVSPVDQAARVSSILSGKSLDMELFVDWENSYGGQYQGITNVVKFMQLLEAKQLKVKDIGLYTGYYFFVDRTKDAASQATYPYLKTKPLWLAWYASQTIVKLPLPWTNWRHWQFGTPIVNWGQPPAELDMSSFNGTPADFTKFYSVSTQHTLDVLVDQVPVYTLKF
jgi:hypothetical protein